MKRSVTSLHAQLPQAPCCPDCGVALEWPARLPDHHQLYCGNGHYLCTMGEFRLAARELLMAEELLHHRYSPLRRAG
ncbi:hypothetical protein [Kushneria aurantia]|uniref:C2H2-type domain-containing protein n=1 Tax=Kushneria aurantia TaxID=504092 RepID=A0ABV6G6I6_9GAMM|nr:hypothetical protein [Kushneria aurantia]